MEYELYLNGQYVHMVIGGKAIASVHEKNVVEFDDRIKEIGECLFAGNNDIEGIIINDNIEIIGDEAFCNCKNVKFVILGKNVKQICNACFTGLSGVKAVIFKGTIKEYCNILKGEPFETINEIECSDGIYSKPQADKNMCLDFELEFCLKKDAYVKAYNEDGSLWDIKHDEHLKLFHTLFNSDMGIDAIIGDIKAMNLVFFKTRYEFLNGFDKNEFDAKEYDFLKYYILEAEYA